MKTFLQKIKLQIDQQHFLFLKILDFGHMVLVILTVKKLLERFMKKNYQRQIKPSVDLKK